MIKFRADSRAACCEADEPITTGSIGMQVSVDLDSAFDGLSCIVVFRGSGLDIDVILIGDSVTVPHEVLTEKGDYLRIGVYARNGDGTIVIPTVWATAGQIRTGTEPSDVDPAEPTPDWTAQVQQAATEAVLTSIRAEQIAEEANERSSEVVTQTEQLRIEAADAVRRAGSSADEAAASAQAAEESADRAEQAAAESGYMYFETENGHVIYYRTANVDVDFDIENGRLILNG